MQSLNSLMPVLDAGKIECDPSCTICFTGHRPGKILPFGNKPYFEKVTYEVIKLFIARYVELAADEGYKFFISGLADGADVWGALSVLDLCSQGRNLELIGVMPYIRHADGAKGRYSSELFTVETNASQLLCTNSDPNITYSRGRYPGTSSDLYTVRNRFMVEHSAGVIAFYDKRTMANSGTGQTVRFAGATQKKVWVTDLNDVYKVIYDSGSDLAKAKELVNKLVPSL